MLRSYEPLVMADEYIYGSDGAVGGTGTGQSQPVSGGQVKSAPPSSADRLKAQRDKEATFVWKDNGNGMLVNQQGQLKTKHPSM